MKISRHEARPLPEQGNVPDVLSPYTQALRKHFPSREDILRAAQQQTRQQRRLKKITAGIAAISVIALSWYVDPVLQREDLHTMVGQQASYMLKDGSRVTLNTNSVLLVEQRLYSRQLRLQQGEALFSVAHAWRPFTVYAHQTAIRDIGTVFNVRHHGQGAVVTVVEGAVDVRTASAQRQIFQNQSVSTHAADMSTTRHASAAAATVWQQGRLMFDGDTLAEVVSELQRYHHGQIEIADARIAHYRMSGEYDINGIDALIDTLPEILPVRIARHEGGTIVIRQR
ncbi:MULTISPECIES: FecR family protein [unclassified Methylophilus]|uniref:FecR family protein n=1 Tax=unclassified Methylophilus TaxID=2630143 RepID=UPI0003677732|nr:MULTISPECIES: FecR domain-containing protein [unclassified Methylophilus]